jgi:hypothetical protein
MTGQGADMTDINDAGCARLTRGFCLDCGYHGFVLGPRGGLCINIECGNPDCRARYNVASGGITHHIVYAERIAKQSEGGSDWSDAPD